MYIGVTTSICVGARVCVFCVSVRTDVHVCVVCGVSVYAYLVVRP